MAATKPCGGCGKTTSFVFAAQYANGLDRHTIICDSCYTAGERCWVLADGSLAVSQDPPEGSRSAALYYDEGGYVTGGDVPMTYPSQEQPDIQN